MQPLAGVRVVSIAFNLPGPAAVWRLRAWGAEVVKVEPPGGDPLALHRSDLYAKLTAGQQIVRLDLKSPAGRAQIDAHLAAADLFITSSLPASLERMELGWQRLHAQFPRLCQVAIVGYPPPDEELTGHDLTYQASVGLVTPPAMPRTLVGDMAGAQSAASLALAALLERERTGEGVLALAPIAAALDFFTLPLEHGMTAPGGQLAGVLPNYNIYPTAKGWLAVAALEPHFFARLKELLALKTGSYEELKAVFATRTAEEWQRWGEENRLPLAAVREM